MHTFASGNAIRQSGRLYGLIPERAAGAPLLAHGKVSCTALRLVHDPAGTGSWVRLRRVGERLGADASSTVGAAVLKAATAIDLYAHTSTSGSRFADAAGPPALGETVGKMLKVSI